MSEEPLQENLSTASVSSSSLKRRASSSFDSFDDNHKRMKEDSDNSGDPMSHSDTDGDAKFVDKLVDELYCGCCSELVYKPVLVMPCQHFFCGSCCVLWTRNGGTNCPACRTAATVAMPFRAIQPVIDSVLQFAPYKTRTERERQQADEVYRLGHTIRFPPPKEMSPAPDMDRIADYIHPCPHCFANNPYDWRCPQPIVDPTADPDNAWHVDDGTPPGHAHCGNCENLLALQAPSTTKCDFCQVSFCGIGVQDRCAALPFSSQQPHNFSTNGDLIQSSEMYEFFGGNAVEVDFMLEYLEVQKLNPRQIFKDIMQHIQKQPRGFLPLIELDLFKDIHSVSPSAEVASDSPRNRTCRLCAAEIFFWGLKDWWIRERQKGLLEEKVKSRKDCPEGSSCVRQRVDNSHAREFNHIFAPSSEVTGTINHQPEEGSSITTSMPAPSAVSANPTGSLAPSVTSSSANSLSFLLNADDVEGQSIHRRSSSPHVGSTVDAQS